MGRPELAISGSCIGIVYVLSCMFSLAYIYIQFSGE